MTEPRPHSVNDSGSLPPWPRTGRAAGLTGRRGECDTLKRLIAAIRAGESQALVVRGDPGAGKTALLEYLAGKAADAGCAVARVVGVQSEMELAFAGLHQLCAPFLDRLGRLPDPQRDALEAAFSLRNGGAPDRFAVGLAALSLLSEVAGDQPLVCAVDDTQWLDRASAHVLTFVARHLAAAPVAMVFAVRQPGSEQDLSGLPALLVGGLADGDARALLASVVIGPLDERVRDRIVAETRGNPQALLEWPRRLMPGELAGGFGLPTAATPLTGQIEQAFRRSFESLPESTRLLLAAAAAELPVLLLQLRDPLLIIGRGPGPHTAVDFRLLCPGPQRLGVNTQLTCDPGQLPTPLTLPLPDLEQHPHRAFAQLIRVLLLCRHDRASSQVSWPPRFPGWPITRELAKAGFGQVQVVDRQPQSIDDLAVYPLFPAELLQLMRTHIPPGKHARIATAIVIKAVARPDIETASRPHRVCPSLPER
jgi:hypothetical protein